MDIRALSQQLGGHAHQICLEIFPEGRLSQAVTKLVASMVTGEIAVGLSTR